MYKIPVLHTHRHPFREESQDYKNQSSDVRPQI